MRPATKKATTIAIRTGIMLLPSLLEDVPMPRTLTPQLSIRRSGMRD